MNDVDGSASVLNDDITLAIVPVPTVIVDSVNVLVPANNLLNVSEIDDESDIEVNVDLSVDIVPTPTVIASDADLNADNTRLITPAPTLIVDSVSVLVALSILAILSEIELTRLLYF